MKIKPMTRAIDLHVHSNRSDGTFSPVQLVDYAMKKNLRAIALTDHDTVDGLDEMMDYAEMLVKEHPDISVPEIIPGIEFSTEYEGRDVHILGLYIEHKTKSFQKYLQDFVASRHLRNEKMCLLLQKKGIPITYEKLQAEFPNSVITRAHYAAYLLKYRYTKSMNEAFERYIGDHGPCYIPREKVNPAQAVEIILQAKGIPVLAHPPLYHMSKSRLDKLVFQLKEIGLMGIEAVYSSYALSEEADMRRLADKYQLLITGGSDFHGANKPGLDLGTGYGKLYVDYEILERIKEKL